MCNEDLQMILNVVISILEILNFLVPIVLIVLCTIDIFKIIVSKKEDEIKKLRKGVIMKIVYAILIYLIPYLVPFIFRLVDNILPMEYDESWYQCWEYVKNNRKNVN